MDSQLLLPVKASENGDTHLNIKVMYIKGRGVVLDVTPIKTMGGGVISFRLCSGETMIVAPLTRYNKKAVDAINKRCEELIEQKVGEPWALVQKVLDKNKLELG